MSETAIIIFLRKSELGKVKTRLANDIGKVHALAVYDFLVQKTLESVKKSNLDNYLFYSDKIDHNETNMNLYIQEGSDLGERMYNAFKTILNKGYKNVLIIGTDCADLEANDLIEATNQLFTHDFVIGPANDGGFYLLGMKDLISEIFLEKQWSHSNVFQDTASILSKKGSIYILPKKIDIDNIADLQEAKLDFLINESQSRNE